jgi:biopolymer transport protein ExbB
LAGIEGGAVDPTILAGGIYTALSTTAVGLTIAIIAFFVQNMIEARIERERNLIDTVISAAIHGRFDPNSS